ncbi:MAG: hypothetical protein ACRDV3_00390 [Acidothermaceae bacterium]
MATACAPAGGGVPVAAEAAGPGGVGAGTGGIGPIGDTGEPDTVDALADPTAEGGSAGDVGEAGGSEAVHNDGLGWFADPAGDPAGDPAVVTRLDDAQPAHTTTPAATIAVTISDGRRKDGRRTAGSLTI